MRAWRQHWNHQLYKALEHQYQTGLEALNKNLPEIHIDLTFKSVPVSISDYMCLLFFPSHTFCFHHESSSSYFGLPVHVLNCWLMWIKYNSHLPYIYSFSWAGRAVCSSVLHLKKYEHATSGRWSGSSQFQTSSKGSAPWGRSLYSASWLTGMPLGSWPSSVRPRISLAAFRVFNTSSRCLKQIMMTLLIFTIMIIVHLPFKKTV